MALATLRIDTRRSGPVFLVRDGETIAHVHETVNRELVLGDGRARLNLPGANATFVIDSVGVTRRGERGAYRNPAPGALLFGLALLVAIEIFRKVTGR